MEDRWYEAAWILHRILLRSMPSIPRSRAKMKQSEVGWLVRLQSHCRPRTLAQDCQRLLLRLDKGGASARTILPPVTVGMDLPIRRIFSLSLIWVAIQILISGATRFAMHRRRSSPKTSSTTFVQLQRTAATPVCRERIRVDVYEDNSEPVRG